MRFRDNRVPLSATIEGGKIVAGMIGGWGPWKIEPPLRGTASDGFADGEYVSDPLPMTQEELRAQYEWASARPDRRRYRPEVV